jgi:molybdenum cofactor cytidylyltransferase
MPELASIVLAAGGSSRFGPENKLTARIDGRPLVRRVVDVVSDATGGEIVVVTGEDAPAIAAVLSGLAVRFVANPNWRTGLSSSIAAGVAALGADVDGAFIVPGDMPFLSADLLRSLASAFACAKTRPIVYPATLSGAQRNPVLWPRRFFPELMALSGPGGAKQLLQDAKAEAVAVAFADEWAFADVDTPADLEAAQRLAASQSPRPFTHGA